MASAYSIARTYNEFIPPVNLDLMAQAMQFKQQKYDANYAAIQGQIDLLGNLDIIKPEDKAYFVDRTNKLVEQINQYGQMDMSSNAVAKQLNTHIKQALDPVVMNALASTKRYRDFQTDVAKVKDKHPDKYSIVNEMYSMRGFQKWMSDGQAGTTLGVMNYTPYTDVQKKYQDIIKDMWVNHKDQTFEVRDGNGLKTVKTWSGLDPKEVQEVVSGLMSSEDANQLAINGWFKYGLATPEVAASQAERYYERASSEWDGEIAKLKKDAKNQSGNKLSDTQGKIAQYEKLKIDLNRELLSNKNSPEAVGLFFEKQNLVNGMQNMHAWKQTGQEFKSDDFYFDKANLQLNIEEFDFKKAMELAKLDLEERKFNAEQGINADGTLSAKGITVTGGVAKPDEQSVDTHMEKFKAEESRLNSSLDSALSAKYKDPKEKMDRVNALKARAEKEGKSYEELVFEELGEDGMTSEEVELQKSYFAQKAIKEELTNTYKEQMSSGLQRIAMADGISDVIFEGNLGKNLNGSGSLKDYWLSKGLNTKEKVRDYLNANPDEKQEVLKQSYGDLLMTGLKNEAPQITNGSGKKQLSPEREYYLTQIASMFGETPSSVEFKYFGRDELEIKGAPKTAAYIKKIRDKGAYSGTIGVPFYRDSLEDSPRIKSALGYNTNKQTYIDKVGEIFNRFDVSKDITVAPSNKSVYAKLAGLASNPSSGFEVNSTSPISFRKVGDNQVEIIQRIQNTKGEYIENKAAIVSVEDFNNSGLGNLFDTSRNTGIARRDLYIPFNKAVGKIYDKTNADDNLRVQGLVIKGYNEDQVTKQGFAKLANQLQGDKYASYRAVINKLANNPEAIVISTPDKATLEGRAKQMNIPLSSIKVPLGMTYKKDGKTISIGTFPIPMTSYSSGTMDEILQSPQSYLYKTLEILVQNAITKGSDEDLNNLIAIL